MDRSEETCRVFSRRERMREQGRGALAGLDFVEIAPSQTSLEVTFIGRAPEGISERSFVIEGGRRVRDIQVVNLDFRENGCDDSCVLTVDKAGDFSTYTLRLVEDRETSPVRPKNVDPRYDSLSFSFKVDCPSDLDCAAKHVCPPEPRQAPVLDYLAKDYGSFRKLIFDRLSLVMPEWKEQHAADFGVAMVELLAYIGDYLSYYQDAVATEAYLDTARQRISIRRHVRLIDYLMHEGCNARAWVVVTPSQDIDIPVSELSFVTRFPDGRAPAAWKGEGTVLLPEHLSGVPSSAYEYFEPLEPGGGQAALFDGNLRFYEAHKEIRFYSWGDEQCCLPVGATRATLEDDYVVKDREPAGSQDQAQYAPKEQSPKEHCKDDEDEPAYELSRKLHLRPGDVLILEEVKGPRTGIEGDASPAHRTAVRLVTVNLTEDPLYPVEVAGGRAKRAKPLVEIEWAPEDALAFPLCLTTLGSPPKCELLAPVSVARGNVVLVDHGRTIREPLGEVPTAETKITCEERGRPSEIERVAGRFRPSLKKRPLTFAVPLTRPGGRPGASFPPALVMLDQDPRAAMPAVSLESLRRPLLPLAETLAGAVAGAVTEAVVEVVAEVVAEAVAEVKSLHDHGHGPAKQPAAKDHKPPQQSGSAKQPAAKKQRAALAKSQVVCPTCGTRAPAHGPETACPACGAMIVPLTWKPRLDLLGSGPEDAEFVVELDNNGQAFLRFGDGDLGKSPEPSMDFSATYRTGNGRPGNVGAETISVALLKNLRSGLSLTPRNPMPAQGGQEREPVEEVKARAPGAIHADLQRAVIAEDYARLAEIRPARLGDARRPRVQDAAADLLWTGSYYEALVVIDPLGKPEPDEQLLRDVDGLLHRFRKIGHDLRVLGARYVPLRVELQVCAKPHALRSHVKAAVLDALSTSLLPGGARGFFHPDNIVFGQDIPLSRIIGVAQAVEGVDSVTVAKLERLFEGASDEIESGALALGPLEVARLDNDPASPENGLLKINVRGGR